MKPLVDSWNIVLAGAWNPAIINPNWIGRNVWETTDLQFEVLIPVMGNQRIMRFPAKDVQVALDAGRLLLSTTSLTQTAMNVAEHLATRVLQLLVHTPVAACGFNYGFEVPQEERFPWVSHLPDHDKLTELLTVEETTIQRRLAGIEAFGKPVLNLKLSDRRDGGFQIDFNYHYDVESSAEAATKVSGGFWGLLDHVESVLTAYNLKLDRPPETEEQTHE